MKKSQLPTTTTVVGFLMVLLISAAVVADGLEQFVAVVGALNLAAWIAYRLASKKPDRTLFKQALLVYGSILLVLICFELPMLLGIVDYRKVLRPPLTPMHDPQNQLDMELLFRRQAHAHFTGQADGGDFGFMYYTEDSEQIRFDAKFDAEGFRNPEPMPQADIVFVGDSFTEALLVATDDVVSSRLGRAYATTAANYGMMTYGPYQERFALERYAIPLKPKVVVWLFFEGNDLGDVSFYEWATEDLIGLRRQYDGLLHRSFSMNASRLLYHRLRFFKPSGYPRSGLIATAGGGSERIYFLHQPKSVDNKIEKALETTRSILSEAYALCRQADIRLVIGFIPVKYRVYHDRLNLDDSSKPRAWSLTEIPERMEAIVKGIAPDLLWVNFLEPLREAVATGQRPYYRVDSHWNSVGHRVASEVLQRAIGDLEPLQTSAVSAEKL